MEDLDDVKKEEEEEQYDVDQFIFFGKQVASSSEMRKGYCRYTTHSHIKRQNVRSIPKN